MPMRVSTRTASFAAVLVSISLVLISATRIWGKEPTGKAFGAWGVDLTSRDLRTPAGDDFFAYANGTWLARTEIPSDQSSTSAGRDVFNLTQDQLRELIEASAAKAATPTGAQIGGLYKSFMDEAGVEAAYAKPLASDLVVFFFQAEDGIRDSSVTGVQTCALPISDDRQQILAFSAEGQVSSVDV